MNGTVIKKKMFKTGSLRILPRSMIDVFEHNIEDKELLEWLQNFDLDKIGPKNNDILYITGVPKNTPSLDRFRLQGKKWSSYYEDEHGGYLFQILTYDQPLKFISHGTSEK